MLKTSIHSYTLNTNVEQPHEGSVKAVEFSSALDTENLLCATAGCDNYLKIWALEDSASIHSQFVKKMWFILKFIYIIGSFRERKGVVLHCSYKL